MHGSRFYRSVHARIRGDMNLKENPMGFLAGKRILVTGLISNRSIAYGVAQSCRAQGAELAFTFQNERFQERVTEMAAEFGSSLVFPCDVAEDAQIDALFSSLRTHWDGLDGLVHAIAFAPREAISGNFIDGLSREAFRTAHDVTLWQTGPPFVFFFFCVYLGERVDRLRKVSIFCIFFSKKDTRGFSPQGANR